VIGRRADAYAPTCDPRAMPSQDIQIQTPDGSADAYLATPPDAGEHPGVLLLMDAFGLRPRIREMADEIAAQGYIVMAPNLFYRAGSEPVPPRPDTFDEDARTAFMAKLGPLLGQLTPEAVARDGGAYLERLDALAPGPAAITGYCLGARVGLLIAAAHPERVAALGGFHGGRIVVDGPHSPHLTLPDVRAEIYFGHADEDPSMTPDQIATLDRAMDEAGIVHRSEVYAGARHGYTMADTPVYDEASTRRHYENLFALLSRALAAR
jgi:carboxymethylenebutenolidase